MNDDRRPPAGRGVAEMGRLSRCAADPSVERNHHSFVSVFDNKQNKSQLGAHTGDWLQLGGFSYVFFSSHALCQPFQGS